jgi:lactam utilization protein B
VNARQHNQRARIQQGVKSGELTRRETRKVVEEQRDVRQLERAYKSDGTLTARERADLHHEQNQASRDIYRQKHDAQDRPVTSGQPGIRDPGVNARQSNQRGRIVQGVKSGELTRPEVRKVAEEQKDVRQLERAYKSDGTLTAAERADLHHEQNQASRDIYRQKHDDQERPNP